MTRIPYFSSFNNPVTVKKGVAEIALIRKDGVSLVSLIDEDDLHRLTGIGGTVVSQYNPWIKGYYAVFITTGGRDHRKHWYLHNFIMNPPDWLEVDHINHDTLDNRKNNLRIVCRHENSINKKRTDNNPHPNVSWMKRYSRWRVLFKRDNRCYFCKFFRSLDDAIEESDRVRATLIKEARYID